MGEPEGQDDDGADGRIRAWARPAYRSSGIFVGKPVSADTSVVAYEKPGRFAIRSEQHQEGKDDIWYVNDYTLTPEGGRTHLTKRVTSNGNPLIFYLAYPGIRADQMTSLRNLKQLAESGG